MIDSGSGWAGKEGDIPKHISFKNCPAPDPLTDFSMIFVPKVVD